MRSNARGRIRVGMAGWVYEPWRGTFYPAGVTHKNELAWASTRVTSIELNGSFYSLQKPPTWKAWAAATPESFVFAVKAPRYLTYVKRLNGIEEPLADFLASGILALGPKLGPILWQLPPGVVYDRDLLERFFTLLPRTTLEAAAIAATHTDRMLGKSHPDTDADRPVRHALEVRDPSFADPEFVEVARKHGIAIVLGDSGGKWPVIDQVTTDFRYVRLHGDEAIYPGGYYEPVDIDRWAQRISGWADSGQDVYAYFDTDTKVQSPLNAMALLEKLTN